MFETVARSGFPTCHAGDTFRRRSAGRGLHSWGVKRSAACWLLSDIYTLAGRPKIEHEYDLA
jgi:hypothetical protein